MLIILSCFQAAAVTHLMMMMMEDKGAGERAASTSTILAASASNPAATPTTTTTAAITNNSRGVRGNEVLVASLDEFLALPNDQDEDEMPAATEFQPIPVPQNEEIGQSTRSRRVSFTHCQDDPPSTVTVTPAVSAVAVETEIRRSSTRVSFTHLSNNIDIDIKDVDLGLLPTSVTDGCNGE